MSDKTISVDGAGRDSNGRELTETIVRLLAAQLDVGPEAVKTDRTFKRLGMTSVMGAAFMTRLSRETGRALPVAMFWSHPTVDDMVHYLQNGEPEGGERVETAEERDDPVAIIGVGCRFPGGVAGPGDFWRLLRDGVDAVGEIPRDRWDMDPFYDPSGPRAGKIVSRRAGLLDNVDRFDPLFFGISPREAVEMDPQQRLMLEVSWEALEDAGIAPGSLRGSGAGVFFGVMNSDYDGLLMERGPRSITTHTATGGAPCIVANRVSYALGLHGPSLTVNTACSSSLHAVHLARQALRTGEAPLALAGGVQLILSPGMSALASRMGVLSPNGRCRAFDAGADGYVRAEGAGVVVLKPLSRALADGSRIYGILSSTSVNSDGPGNGLTAPNSRAQTTLFQNARIRAGVDPADVQYVELHGTGTSLGDPIEAEAVGRVYGQGRPADRPLLVGSVKTNIGHAEAAAGIAGLIKTVLSIHHRELPPSLHFETPNPHIDFDRLGLRVAARRREWPGEGAAPLRAGVNSFGFGGANAHALVEEAEPSPTLLLPLSADTGEALVRRAGEARSRLTDDPGRTVRETVWELIMEGPLGEERRMAALGRSRAELVNALDAFIRGVESEDAYVGRTAETPLKPVFVYSGFGHQWFGMGRALLAGEPVFRSAFLACDREFRKTADWSLLEELLSPESRTLQNDADSPHIVQPLLLTIQIALTALWRSWGVTPGAVVGHSIGEIAAAHAAGALDLPTTMRLVRGMAVVCRRCVAESGGMFVFVAKVRGDLAEVLRPYRGKIFIAGDNAPGVHLISGEAEAMGRAIRDLQEGGAFCHVLWQGDGHCKRLAPFMEALPDEVGELTPRSAATPMYSTLRAREIEGGELDIEYWKQNIQSPVRFAGGIAHFATTGRARFLEISAHPVMSRSVEKTAAHLGVDGRSLPSQHQDEDGRRTMRRTLAELYTLGADVRWDKVYRRRTGPGAVAPSVADGRGKEAPGLHLLPLSGGDSGAARAAAVQCRDYLRETGAPLSEVCAAFSGRRTHHEHRICVVGADHEALAEALDAFSRGDSHPGLVRGRRRRAPRLGLIFSGSAPGRGLFGSSIAPGASVFHAALKKCDRVIARATGRSILNEKETDGNHTDPSRPERVLLRAFSHQFSMASLLRFHGVESSGALGLGVGAAAAAAVAGVLDLEEGVEAVREMAGAPLKCTGAPGSHSPGPSSAVFYSPAAVRGRHGKTTGRDARSRISNHSGPWRTAVQAMVEDGIDLFLEIGEIHGSMGERTRAMATGKGRWIAIPWRGRNEAFSFLKALGELHAIGYPVDLRALHPMAPPVLPLPTYPWQGKRYWISRPDAAAGSARTGKPDATPSRTPTRRTPSSQASTPLSPAQPREAIQDRLAEIASRVLEAPAAALDPGASLYDYGLDSLIALEIMEAVENELGIRLPSDALAGGASILALAGALSEKTDSLGPAVDKIQPGTRGESDVPGMRIHTPRPGAPMRLICFPHAAAGAVAFNDWAGRLPDFVELSAFQPPGRETRANEAPALTFEDYLDEAVSAALPLLDRPFVFYGHSLGGLIAFECIRELRRRGGPLPEALMVGASPGPDLPFEKASHLPDEDLLHHLAAMEGGAVGLVDAPRARKRMMRTLRADLLVRENYVHAEEEPIPCAIEIYAGSNDAYIAPPALESWAGQTSGPSEIHMLPGGHFFFNDHADSFFEILGGSLARYCHPAMN